MQRFYLVGPWKYLTAGLIFLTGSVGLFLNFMNSKLYLLLGFPAGIFLFSIMMLWFYFLYKKNGEDPLHKYIMFFSGYLFSFLGLSFALAGIHLLNINHPEAAQALIPGIICFLIGLVLMIMFLKNRFRGGSEQEILNREYSLASVIGITVAVIVLIPFLLIGIYAIFTENYAAGIVFLIPVVIFAAVFSSIKINQKRS